MRPLFVLPVVTALASMSSPLPTQTTPWSTNGSSIWYAPTGINVGIGTASPPSLLDLSAGVLWLRDKGDNCCSQFIMGSNGMQTHLYQHASGRLGLHKYGPGSADGVVFSILANGNVGIGTMTHTRSLNLDAQNVYESSNFHGVEVWAPVNRNDTGNGSAVHSSQAG